MSRLIDEPSKLYNRHEAACIIAELFGDTCACNYNDNDEWLPEYCDFVNDCPDVCGVACWEQYLKYRALRTLKESKENDV